METIIAIDFETFYDSEYSLRNLSTYLYVFDERFDAYLLSAYGDNGVSFVGKPSEFNWNLLTGNIVAIHNASFDELVMKRLRQDGVIPETCQPKEIICTADLAAYNRTRRNLKDAAKFLLGEEEVDKTVRSKMKNLTYEEAVKQGLEQELLNYATEDARHCYNLAKKYLADWPENERTLSRLNREAGFRGVHLNREAVDAAVKTLQDRLNTTLLKIPWMDGDDPDAKPTSYKYARLEARKIGIQLPASLAKDSPEFLKVQEEHGDKHPWLRAMGEYRSVNTFLLRARAMQANLQDDDFMPYNILYYGAHTGRMSGGSAAESGKKVNLQNQPRYEVYGVDFRALITPRPGYKLVVADYGQIEPRLLWWRVGDTAMLDQIREAGGNCYIAFSRHVLGRDIEKNTPGYQLAKAQVLLLGYHGGAARFQTQAAAQYRVELSMDEAQYAVTQYRGANPRIVNHWEEHQKWLKHSVNHMDPYHEVELADGRSLVYYQPTYQRDRFGKMDIYAATVRGAPRSKVHGGVLTNNEIQGTAYGVLRDAYCAVEKELGPRGVSVWFSVHDELVCEVPEKDAEEFRQEIERLMLNSSPWVAGCPLAVESGVVDYYQK